MCRRIFLALLVVVLTALQGCAGGFPEKLGSSVNDSSDELHPMSTAD